MPTGATTPYPWKCSVQIYGGAILPPGSQKTSGTTLDKCWKFQMWGWFFAAVAGGPTSGRSFGLLGRLAACIRRGGAPPTWESGSVDYGAGFLPLLWEARPRGEALAFGQACGLHSPRGRASYMGKRLDLTVALGFCRCCGRPDLGANGLRLGQACRLHSPRGAPPTWGSGSI